MARPGSPGASVKSLASTWGPSLLCLVLDPSPYLSEKQLPRAFDFFRDAGNRTQVLGIEPRTSHLLDKDSTVQHISQSGH